MRYILSLIFLLVCSPVWGVDYTQDANCQGAWLLDESSENTCSGGEDACNEVGTNHGTILSSGANLSASGQFGTAYDFVGGNGDFISFGTDISLTGDFTLVAYVELDSTGLTYGIITRTEGHPYHHNYYLNAHSSNYWEFGFYDSTGSTWRNSTGGTTSTSYTHVAGTWNNTTKDLILYVDGVDVTTNNYASATPANSGTLVMGSSNGGGDSFMNGSIDEVAIFDRVLSKTEIQDIRDNGLKGASAATDGYIMLIN